MTTDEEKKPILDAMGAPLGELFYALSTELTWMFIRWIQFQKLYTRGEARVDVLNQSASFFFWVVQQTLWEDTLLGLSRLGGPAKSLGKDNLAIRRLIPLIGDVPLRDSIQGRMDKLDAMLLSTVDLRNRRLAHRDLALALDNSPVPLPDVEIREVDEALDAMAGLLNEISNHFMRSTTGYRFASLIQDADQLLYVLRDGLRREELRMKKLESGEWDPADWNDEGPPL